MISRGDTTIIPCRFKNALVAPEDGTKAIVTLKRDYNDKNMIWQKECLIVGARFQIELDHDDTNLLNDVSYYYDIQLRYLDGQIYTLIPPTEFKILGVVTDV